MSLSKDIERLRPRFVRKSEWWVTRWLAVLLKPMVPNFMEGFWTTIGRTIAYPDSVGDPFDVRHRGVLLHEMVHVQQWDRWWILMPISYVLFPFPVVFAWSRWRWEREAYLIQINREELGVSQVVDFLWNNYGWCWPREWMERWFDEHKAKFT